MISSIFDYLIGTRWKLSAIISLRSFNEQKKVFVKRPAKFQPHQGKTSQVPRKLKRCSATKLKTNQQQKASVKPEQIL